MRHCICVCLQEGGENIHFLYIKRNGLYFVCATKFNVGPAEVLELLSRLDLDWSSGVVSFSLCVPAATAGYCSLIPLPPFPLLE